MKKDDKPILVKLYAPSLEAYEKFELTHAERILNYSQDWELADDNFEFADYELKKRTTNTPGPEKNSDHKKG